MAKKLTTTVRLDPEDAEALARARADGHSASELIRKGLRVVASRYYRRRKAPTTGLFVSTSLKLGDEDELFADHLQRLGCAPGGKRNAAAAGYAEARKRRDIFGWQDVMVADLVDSVHWGTNASPGNEAVGTHQHCTIAGDLTTLQPLAARIEAVAVEVADGDGVEQQIVVLGQLFGRFAPALPALARPGSTGPAHLAALALGVDDVVPEHLETHVFGAHPCRHLAGQVNSPLVRHLEVEGLALSEPRSVSKGRPKCCMCSGWLTPFPGRLNQTPKRRQALCRNTWSSGFLWSSWMRLWQTYWADSSLLMRSSRIASSANITSVPVRVLGERLIDADPDLLARLHLSFEEVGLDEILRDVPCHDRSSLRHTLPRHGSDASNVLKARRPRPSPAGGVVLDRNQTS